jgi:hypothetical protein
VKRWGDVTGSSCRTAGARLRKLQGYARPPLPRERPATAVMKPAAVPFIGTACLRPTSWGLQHPNWTVLLALVSNRHLHRVGRPSRADRLSPDGPAPQASRQDELYDSRGRPSVASAAPWVAFLLPLGASVGRPVARRGGAEQYLGGTASRGVSRERSGQPKPVSHPDKSDAVRLCIASGGR